MMGLRPFTCAPSLALFLLAYYLLVQAVCLPRLPKGELVSRSVLHVGNICSSGKYVFLLSTSLGYGCFSRQLSELVALWHLLEGCTHGYSLQAQGRPVLASLLRVMMFVFDVRV